MREEKRRVLNLRLFEGKSAPARFAREDRTGASSPPGKLRYSLIQTYRCRKNSDSGGMGVGGGADSGRDQGRGDDRRG